MKRGPSETGRETAGDDEANNWANLQWAISRTFYSLMTKTVSG